MSEEKSNQKFILEEISQIHLDMSLETSKLIKINENTFAFTSYHYVEEFSESQIDYIHFYSVINNNFNSVGKYKFNNKIIKIPNEFIQMKVENNNLIIITKQYLIVEKIKVNNYGRYSF